jgi:hypothetical protein
MLEEFFFERYYACFISTVEYNTRGLSLERARETAHPGTKHKRPSKIKNYKKVLLGP